MGSIFPETMTQDILVSCVLLGCIAIVGLVGNALMLRALIKYRRLRTDFYTMFGSLTIADTIFLIVGTITQIVDLLFSLEVISTPWCRITFHITTACGFIAGYLIVVLAVLRGILLTNRNTIRRPQAIHLVIVSVVMYVLAIISAVPLTLLYTSADFICNFDEATLKRETWIISSFSTFVPILLVLVIYFMTYLVGKRYFSDSYSPREKEKARLVTSIVIAFGICQIPYRIASIYDTYIDFDDIEGLMKMFTVKNYLFCLVMADKAVRPILYSKLASDLSEAFDEVINCTYCSKPYTMTPVFDSGSCCAASSPMGCESPRSLTTYISSSDSNILTSLDGSSASGGERTISTSSSTSATSQTPLTRREDETIEMHSDTCIS